MAQAAHISQLWRRCSARRQLLPAVFAWEEVAGTDVGSYTHEDGIALTASMRGVVPNMATTGEKKSPARMSAKNAAPVANNTLGVMVAATPHPHLRKTTMQSERRVRNKQNVSASAR